MFTSLRHSHNHKPFSRVFAIVMGIMLMLSLTSCAPGSTDAGSDTPDKPADSATQDAAVEDKQPEVSTDISKAEKQTLVVWDQEVRGGQNEQIEKLNKAFMDKYPNITIERHAQTFDDFNATLRLALTSKDAPHVVQANNARSTMGQFVAANQLVSLEPWREAYKWDDHFGENILMYSSYSADGKKFGEGNVYGLPQVGEAVGIFYNKALLKKHDLTYPKDFESFKKQLADLKEAGETPLMLGNVGKWPAIHVFGIVQGAFTDAKDIANLGFGNPGSDWTAKENVDAANLLKEWAEKGMFNEGFNGLDYDPAWQQFAEGEGVYLLAGSWLAPDLAHAMGDDVGFMLPPPVTEGEKTVTTGGTGLPFAITTAAPDTNVAAAYIDFLTNADAMKILAETGNVPVVGASKYAEDDGVLGDVNRAFDVLSQSGGMTPYLDWATPTMDKTLGAALQEILGGQINAEEFTEKLAKDYNEATK